MADDRPAPKEADVIESQKEIVKNALNTGKPQSALQNLRGLLRAHPEDASLHSLMGLTQIALKNPGRAVAYMKSAYKLDKSVANGLNLSAAYIESGDYEKADNLLRTVAKRPDLKDYPTPERLYQNLGVIAVRRKRLVKAEQWFGRALEENPTYHPAHMELGRIFEQTRRPAMALKSYRAAIDFCQVCYEPLESLSSLYMKSGRYIDARLLLATYMKNSNVAPEDKNRANQLLRLANASGLGSQTKR